MTSVDPESSVDPRYVLKGIIKKDELHFTVTFVISNKDLHGRKSI